jgi:hypothetical protein
MLEIMEEAHEINEVRKFYKLIQGLKTGFQVVRNGLTNGLPVPGFCTMSRSPECQEIFGQAQHPHGSPPTLLTRFAPLQLLPLPQAEEYP